jgi:hypothetical protein
MKLRDCLILCAGTILGGINGALLDTGLHLSGLVSGSNALAGIGLGFGGDVTGFLTAACCILIASRKENG